MDLNVKACWDCGAGWVVFHIVMYTLLLGLPLGMIFAAGILDRLQKLPSLAKGLRIMGAICLPVSAFFVLGNVFRGI
jgi:hypothetical protein